MARKITTNPDPTVEERLAEALAERDASSEACMKLIKLAEGLASKIREFSYSRADDCYRDAQREIDKIKAGHK